MPSPGVEGVALFLVVAVAVADGGRSWATRLLIEDLRERASGKA